MKKLILILIASLLLGGWACAQEAAPTEALPSAAPTAVPQGEIFASEDLIVTLPYGLSVLDAQALSGYEAAVQDDFPAAGPMLLAAVNDERSAVLSFTAIESAASAQEAAAEAARIILGDNAAVSEAVYGENSYATFSCSIGEDVYSLYFLGGEERLLLVGASGIGEVETAAMLEGIVF